MDTSGENAAIADTRILIVEDHPVVREGVASLVNSEQGMVVCGQTDDPREVHTLIQEQHPDLVLLDLSLGGNDGLELIKEIRSQFTSVSILVLSMHEEMLFAERALKAGASGYLMKREASSKILSGIRSVAEGKIFVSREVSGSFMQRSLKSSNKDGKYGLDALSDRELHVFQLIGAGQTTRSIAEQLGISVKTVESHRENIKNKLCLDNSTSLVRAATLWFQEHRR